LPGTSTDTPQEPGDTGNPWTVRLTLLVMAHMAGTVNIISVLAMAPIISDDLNLSATEFGFFITAYYCAQAFWSLPAGALVDRYGVGKVLGCAHLIMGAGSLLLVSAGSYAFSLVGLFLMGIGYSMTNPATSAGVLAWFPAERRGTAMGIKQVGVPLGGVIAAGSGALAAVDTWQTIMVATALGIFLNGLLCLYLIRFHRPPQKGELRAVGNLRAVFRIPHVQVFTLISGLTNMGQTNFFAFLTLFLREAANASQPMAGFAIGLAQASSAVARIGWGVVSDKWYRRRRGVLMALICGVATVLLGAMVFVGPGWGLWLGLGLAFLLGITIASFAPVAQAIAVEMVEPRLSGSAMGYTMTGVHIGGMIGPPLFGAAIDMSGSYATGWLVTAGLTGLGVIMLAVWFRGNENNGRGNKPA
jgi:MFS transporter, ACS family, hexuronate transporter